MSDYPHSVPGEQLVYSNVEAEFSTTNRRGFQVWLVSPKLREHQREIARRLEDFDWPTRDATANFLTQRHCFFRINSGHYVIARTVPLQERDVLNRAGRFHSHAVVLSAESLAKIHGNPFAVWDHFPFQDDPKAAIEQELWKHDDPFKHEPIRVGPPGEAEPFAVEKLLPLLACWLDDDSDTRPVGVPAPPARMLAWVRAMMQRLPAELRGRFSVDTLSTGQALGTLNYRVAGSYDAASLRDWAYRRCYKLDLEEQELTPSPTPPERVGLTVLARSFATQSLSEEDRNSAYLLLKGLQKTNPGSLPERVTERAVELVSQTEDIEAGFAQRINDRILADVPFPALLKILEAPLRERIGRFSSDSLALVRKPLSVEVLADSLRTAVNTRPLTQDQATELDQWASQQLRQQHPKELKKTLGELFVIAARWSDNRVTRLREILLDPEWYRFCEHWLLTWLAQTSPMMTKLLDPEQCEATIDQHFQARLSDPRAIDDAEVLLTVNPDALPQNLERRLAFVIAIHQADYSGLEEQLQKAGDRLPFLSWVFTNLIQYGWLSEFRLGVVEGQPQAGILLRPQAGSKEQGFTLLDACGNDNWLRRRLLSFLVTNPPAGFEHVNDDTPNIVQAVKAYERLSWTKLFDTFAAMNPAEFCYAVSKLIGDKVLVQTHHYRTDDGVWFGQVLGTNNFEPERFREVSQRMFSVMQFAPQLASGFIHATLFGLKVH